MKKLKWYDIFVVVVPNGICMNIYFYTPFTNLVLLYCILAEDL